MKVRLMVLVLSLMLVSVVSAGDLGIALVTGYTMTAFEDQDDAAGTLPLGITLSKQMQPNLEVGLDVKYALGGFSFETEIFETKFTTTFDYTIIDLYGKYLLGTGSRKPYVKGAVGYFLGNGKFEVEDESESFDIDPGIGFIVGAGMDITPKIYAEFNYNIVSRKADGSDESGGMNSWAILLGYRLK